MPSAFTFRCPHCDKLLGASRSRIGNTVDCPRCKAELSVPSPEEDARPAEAARPRKAGPPPPAFEPYFPELDFQEDPYSLRGDKPERASQRSGESKAARSVATSTPSPESVRNSTDSGESAPALSTSGDAFPTPVGAPSPRRNDVQLPRTALILWSFIVLLAIVFAFLTGYLAGRSL